MSTTINETFLQACPIIIQNLEDAFSKVADRRILEACSPVLIWLAKQTDQPEYQDRLNALVPLAIERAEEALLYGRGGRLNQSDAERQENLATYAILLWLAYRPVVLGYDARLTALVPKASEIIKRAVIVGGEPPWQDYSMSMAVLNWYAGRQGGA